MREAEIKRCNIRCSLSINKNLTREERQPLNLCVWALAVCIGVLKFVCVFACALASAKSNQPVSETAACPDGHLRRETEGKEGRLSG